MVCDDALHKCQSLSAVLVRIISVLTESLGPHLRFTLNRGFFDYLIIIKFRWLVVATKRTRNAQAMSHSGGSPC